MKLLTTTTLSLLLLLPLPLSHSVLTPLPCTDRSRLCTSFLAFPLSPNLTLPRILSMFDATAADITSDSSTNLLYVRKNCSCLTSNQYLANTTLTLTTNSGLVSPIVAAAYAGLQLPTNSTRHSHAGAVISLHLLCGCSSGLENYLLSYVTKDGDTVESLSSRFGASMDSIETVNSLPGPDHITVGQVYYIPLDSAPGQPFVAKGLISSVSSPAPDPAPSPSIYVFTEDPKHHSGGFPYGWIVGSMGVVVVVIILVLLSCVVLKSSRCLSDRGGKKDSSGNLSHKFQILKRRSFCYASGIFLL